MYNFHPPNCMHTKVLHAKSNTTALVHKSGKLTLHHRMKTVMKSGTQRYKVRVKNQPDINTLLMFHECTCTHSPVYKCLYEHPLIFYTRIPIAQNLLLFNFFLQVYA